MVQRVQNRRRGMSLIELVVVMWGTTVVLLLVGQLIHLLYRGAAGNRDRVAELSNLDRLAQSFRGAARTAPSAVVAQAADKLTFRAATGDEIEYATAGERVTVTYRSKAGQRTGGDSFALGSPKTRFELAKTPVGGLARVVLARRLGPHAAADTVELRIDAALSAQTQEHAK